MTIGKESVNFLMGLAKTVDQLQVTTSLNEQLYLENALNIFGQRVLKCKHLGGKLVFIGNGGSSAIASHMAIDFWKNGDIPAMSFNDASMLTCISNDFGYHQVFSKPLQVFAKAQDLLIAISSSGSSKNILEAVYTARKIGCGIISLSGFEKQNPLRQLGDLNFYVPSSNYGTVEIMHLSIIHSLLEVLIHENSVGKKIDEEK